jgi:hypothetical protein
MRRANDHASLPAGEPKTVHWGYWDGSLAPILTIRSVDSVTLVLP